MQKRMVKGGYFIINVIIYLSLSLSLSHSLYLSPSRVAGPSTRDTTYFHKNSWANGKINKKGENGCAEKPWKMMLLKVARWHACALAHFYTSTRVNSFHKSHVHARFDRARHLWKKYIVSCNQNSIFELIIKLYTR